MKLLWIYLIAVTSHSLLAETTIPNVDRWVEELNTDKTDALRIAKIAFVTRVNERPSIVGALSPPPALEYLLSVVSKKDLQWNLKINQESSKSDLIKKIIKLSHANTIFELNDKSSSMHFRNTKEVILGMGEKEAYANPSKFWSSFIQSLGYDGMILDRRDQFVLAVLFDKKTDSSNKQAIVYENSQHTFFAEKKNASSLLQAVRQNDYFTIFEVVLGSPSSLTPGSKIITENFSISKNP